MPGQEDILQLNNFKHGYITDGADYPKESVQDCSNLDFEENRISRRKPYHFQTDLSGIVPAGYSIAGLHNKTFTDGAGTEKEILILLVKNDSSPDDIKVFISDWYYPTSAYGNSKTGTAGWTGLWTEITKTYTGTLSSAATASDTGQKLVITGNSTFQGLDENELRGWFVCVDGVIIGQVTKYVADNSGDSEIYIARGQKILTDISEPKQSLGLMEAGSTAEITLYRFPVVFHNAGFFTGEEGLTECTFAEFPNGIRITCGTVSRVLWLGFLTEKQFFGTAADVNTGDYLFTADWNGFWFDYDIPDIKNKDILYKLSSADGANDPTVVNSLVLAIEEVKKDTGVTSTTSRTSTGGTNKVTFYNKTDFEEIGIILKPTVNYYQIIDDNSSTDLIDTYWVSQMIGLCLEIDGMQAIYLKHFFGQRQVNTIDPPPDKRNLCNIEAGIVFNPDFNRRYTAVLQFYGKGDLDNVNNFQVTNDFTNFAVYQLPDANYGRQEHNSAKHTLIADEYYTLPVELEDGQQEYGENGFQRTDHRIGLSLKSYLNMNFWKDVWVKTNKIIKLGEDNIAVHLSDDSVSTDTLQDKRGAFKIAISNLQNAGGSNAGSCYSDERVRQITLGEKLITGEGITGNQFLLFTNKDCFYYELADNVQAIPQLHLKFDNAGTYSSRTLIKAQYRGQYAGIYWIGKRGIYRFLNNKPECITDNRWEKEFELYTEAEKALAILGFLPRTLDIFVIMPTDLGGGSYTYKIFLWNIKAENWRKYTYSDIPLAMINSKDEEIWFLSGENGTYLYKTATPAEAVTKYYDTREATETKSVVSNANGGVIWNNSTKELTVPLESTDPDNNWTNDTDGFDSVWIGAAVTLTFARAGGGDDITHTTVIQSITSATKVILAAAVPASPATTGEPKTTNIQASCKVDIPIMLEKMLTHGSRKTYKTFSRIETAYKHAESSGNIIYSARGNGSSANDLLYWLKAIDESRNGYGIDTIDITAGYSNGSQLKARKAVNFYNIKIETSGNNTTPGFGDFIIDEIIIAAELRGRSLNR